MALQLSTSLSSTHPGDQRQGARNIVERSSVAAAAGLDGGYVGDHHAMAVNYFANVPIIGRIAPDWDGRLLGCLFLVPLWHPVLMAEQIGTLASLHDGEFVVQTGLGRGEQQFAAMGVDERSRGRLLEAGIVAVQAMLAGETVDVPEFGLVGARIAPTPPNPVRWMIAGDAPVAIDRAARLGTGWYGNANLTPTTAAAKLASYREACATHGRTPYAAVRKDVIVADTAAAAAALGDPMVAAGYRGFPPESVAYGDPAQVAEQLAVYGELGFDEVVVRQMAAVPQDVALRSCELLGEVRRLLRAG